MDHWLTMIDPLAVLGVVAFFVAVESFGIPLPGETVLVSASLLAVGGDVSPVLVWLAAVVGAVLGDSAGYAIGRRFGVRLLTVGARRFPNRLGPGQVQRAIGLMNRWGPVAVAGGRFVAFLRILVGPLAGTLRMPYRRFFIANLTGAVLWAGAVVAIVYSLGRAAVEVIHQASWIVLLALLVAALVLAIALVYRSRRRAVVETAGGGDAASPQALTIGDLFESDGSLSELAARAGAEPGPLESAGVAGLRGIRSAVGVVLRPIGLAVRRTPFTAGLLGAFLVAGLTTGALWRPVEREPWYHAIAFGVPSFLDGRWWTLITGTFFATAPILYAVVMIGIVVCVGWAERHFGTLRAFGIFAGGQIVGVAGLLFILLAARSFDSTWADDLAARYDVGPSGGVLACLAAVLVTVRAPWRLRLRFALFAYVTVSLIYIGSLEDLIHFIAVVAVMLSAPFVQGRLRTAGRPSVREWRLLAFAGLVILAVVEIVGTLFPTDDTLRATDSTTTTWLDVALDVVVIAFIANGVRRGHRLPWVVAVVLGVFNVLEFVGLAVYAFVALDFPPDLFTAMANSALWVALLVLLLLGHRAYRVPLRRSRRALRQAPDARGRSPLDILTERGGGTLSWMTMWPGNSYFVTADGASFIAYQSRAGVALALGDPVGPEAERSAAIAEFAGECERIGLAPALFSVGDTTLGAAPAGWTSLQVAEDTIIDLPTLEMTGKKWQGIRSALNRADREKIGFRMTSLADEPWSVVSQVRAISEEWVGDKALPEMGFTLGGVDEALDPHVRTALALDEAGTVQGVLSWLPVFGEDDAVRGWTLDLMRRRDDGFKPVMEFLIASSCLAFQAEGALFVSLSGAPLAHSAGYQASGIDAVLDGVGRMLEPLYGFQSLHNFKTKFNPRYERLSLLYRDESDLPKIAVALTRAFLPNESLLGIARMGLSRP